MSTVATWSTKAAPLASVAGAVVLILGVLSLVHAVNTLALGDAAWSPSAWACMALAVAWAGLRLFRFFTRSGYSLSYDASRHCFMALPSNEPLELVRVWHGAAWACLALRPLNETGPVIRVIVWKSVVSPPLWSELSLRMQAGLLLESRHQNKENP